MGMLRISTWGSFAEMDVTFKAQSSGHAVAVDDAIKFLQGKILPIAKLQDKKLRSEGAVPDDNFKAADERKLLE